MNNKNDKWTEITCCPSNLIQTDIGQDIGDRLIMLRVDRPLRYVHTAGQPDTDTETETETDNNKLT